MADPILEMETVKKIKKKRKVRSVEETDHCQGPSKVSRINDLVGENRKQGAEEEQGKLSEDYEEGHPWRNLQLILLLQNKDIDPQKKVDQAFDYVKSRVGQEAHYDIEALETISISRAIVFLNSWVQSLLISSEKKIRAEENTHQLKNSSGFCLDYRCWEIFKFCLTDSLKLNVSLSFSRDFLRVIHCIANEALTLMDTVLQRDGRPALKEGFKLHSTVLDCITLLFSSHGGVSNESLDLWILTVGTVLELVLKVYNDKLDNAEMGNFALQFSSAVIESFSKFLRVHPTRKNGFHDFIEKLLEPLLHLVNLLHVQTNITVPGWTRNLLKLVEEVLSQGLFHSTHLDGFLSLQSANRYNTSADGKPKDLKAVIKSYHRHLFDKLEKLIAGRNVLALGGLGQMFHLFVDFVKKQHGVSVRGSRNLIDGSSASLFNNTSAYVNVVSEKSHCPSGMNAETRRSLFDFFVQIMDPLLLEVNTYIQVDVKIGPMLWDIHCLLKSLNKMLFRFAREDIYLRTEDNSGGACLNFLKSVYDMALSFSFKLNGLLPSNVLFNEESHNEFLILIAKELILSVRYLVEIEYEVVGDDLEGLWLMIFSLGALGFTLKDVSDQSPINSEILQLGCLLINLYGELRLVNSSIFALCKAVRDFVLPVGDYELNCSRFLSCNTLYYESCKKLLRMILCSADFRMSISCAIKSIPEGQASGCIKQLTSDISESLQWVRAKWSSAVGNEQSASSPSLINLLAELLGRDLCELYTLILDTLSVTPGNSNLVAISLKDLMAVIQPSMSILIGLQPNNINEFLSVVTGRTIKVQGGSKSNFLSGQWIFLLFFRIYMSGRSLFRQSVSLLPPNTSRKMSEVMGDLFTAFSGKDWLERTSFKDDGYFSWILRPSASLPAIIESISDIYLQDTDTDCSPLIFVLNVMVLQRLVDLNRLIKSAEYLVQKNMCLAQTNSNDDAGLAMHAKRGRRWKRHVLELRKEAADLTMFMMRYLSLVAKDQLSSSIFDDVIHRATSAQALYNNYVWNFGVGAVSKTTLPSILWWVFCQNIDVWCTHAAKKKLKKFLSILIHNSLLFLSSRSDKSTNQITTELGHMKKVTACQISVELLKDIILYEQRFVRRYMASRFCKILKKLALSIFSKYGEDDLKERTDWSNVLKALEDSAFVPKRMNDCSSGAKAIRDPPMVYCKDQEYISSIDEKFAMLQTLFNFFCWMPKGYLSAKSSSLYATYILNIERSVVGSLLDCRGVLYSYNECELLRLFVSCRRSIHHLVLESCEGRAEDNRSSLPCLFFENSFPVLWLLKSLSAIIGLQDAFPENCASQVKDMIFSLMDHTSYVSLMLCKHQFIWSFSSLVSAEKPGVEDPNSAVSKSDFVEFDPCLDPSKDNSQWESVVLIAETLRREMEHLFTCFRESHCDEKERVFASIHELDNLSSIISCFQGFLWGLAFALDYMDAKDSNFRANLSRWSLGPLRKVYLVADSFMDCISYFLHFLFLEDNHVPKKSVDAPTLTTPEYSNDVLVVQKSSFNSSHNTGDVTHEKQQSNSAATINQTTSFDVRSNSSRRVRKKRAHCVNNSLTNVDLFEHQSLKKSFLKSLLRGENPEAAFFLRQLFVTSSAMLRLNLWINSISLSTSLIPVFIGISQVLLLEFAAKADLEPFSFVWLDGVVTFLEELGSHFSLCDPTLSKNLYINLINLHLRAIGKCIVLQGKAATLMSHEAESRTKTLQGEKGTSESNPSHGPCYLGEIKTRLRMSLKAFVKKPSELHLQSAIQAIERALVGIQDFCLIKYEISSGCSDGGKVSSIVAGGIDCLDLALEFVTGRKKLKVITRHIQSLVACLFNIIVHLQGPKIFYGNVLNRDSPATDPDPGSVTLMCVEVLTRVSGKHALFQFDDCHVGQSLRVPAALFKRFLQLRICDFSAPSNFPRFMEIEDENSVIKASACSVDRQYSIELYAACCQLLSTVLKHHKSKSLRCFALLEDSVRVLLHCLEMVKTDQVGKLNCFEWEILEGVKCASFLRRVYEELRQQKDVFGRHCFQLLSDYIWVYCGYGPSKTGFRRETDDALKPGVYALIDACSEDDLQHLHTVFGEGPCRSTLASLQHDYKLKFQYEGKV